MKNRIPFYLIIFMNLIALTAISQTTTFPSELATWKYFCIDESENNSIYFNTQNLVGDSIYNGTQYQKIEAQQLSTFGESNGLIRVDQEQVYFIPKDSLSELLLYDFSLEQGDTFSIASYHQRFGQYEKIVVMSIDSIQTSDDVQRKLFHFSDGNYWLEGIGALRGTVTYPWYFESLSGECNLSCYAYDSEDLYRDTFIVSGGFEDFLYSCEGLITSLEEVTNSFEMEVFPNPFDTEINVTINTNEPIAALALYDVNAKLIKAKNNTNQIQLDKTLTSGVYFLSVTIGDYVFFEKLIKQ